MAKTQEQSILDGDQPVTVTLNDLLAAVAKMAGSNQLTADAIAEAVAKATAAVTERVFDSNAANERNYPAKSWLNPQGEREHPRPEINGEIFLLGTLMQREEMTHEEIALVNAIEPFDGMIQTRSGAMIRLQILNLEPPGSPKRRLLILFPNKDQNERADLPSLVQMLRQAVPAGAAA